MPSQTLALTLFLPLSLLACSKKEAPPAPAEKPAEAAPPLAATPQAAAGPTTGLDLALVLPAPVSATLPDAEIFVLDEPIDLASYKAALGKGESPAEFGDYGPGSTLDRESTLPDGWVGRMDGPDGEIVLIVRTLAGKPVLCKPMNDKKLGESECMALSSPDGKQLRVAFKLPADDAEFSVDGTFLSLARASAESPASAQAEASSPKKKIVQEEKLGNGFAALISDSGFQGETQYFASTRTTLGGKDIVCSSAKLEKQATASKQLDTCKRLTAL